MGILKTVACETARKVYGGNNRRKPVITINKSAKRLEFADYLFQGYHIVKGAEVAVGQVGMLHDEVADLSSAIASGQVLSLCLLKHIINVVEHR